MGRGKKKKTAWWTPELQEAVRVKQKAFRIWMKERTVEMRASYNTERNIVNSMRKQAKEDMCRKISEDLTENHAGKKNLMYSMARRYRKKGGETAKNIKDEHGNILFEDDAIKKRWNEYFSQLLNVTDSEGQVITVEANNNEEQLDPDRNEVITLDEIRNALKMTKNNRSPGPDKIPIEVIKVAGPRMLHFLYKLFNEAYFSGSIPPE